MMFFEPGLQGRAIAGPSDGAAEFEVDRFGRDDGYWTGRPAFPADGA